MYPSLHDATECRDLPLDGIYTDTPESALLWSLFRLPPDCPYASHAIVLYQQFHHCCCAFEPEANTYYRCQRERLALQLETLLPLETATSSPLPQHRRQLHAYLTHYPLFCSLLLMGNEEQKKQNGWLWLLVRVYHAMGPDVYEAYLAFDRLRAAYPADVPFIELGMLTQGSQHALAQALTEHPYLAPLAPYVKRRHSHARRRPLYQAANVHTTTRVENAVLTATVKTTSDQDGNAGESWLTLSANQPLSDQAAKRQFAQQSSGMARAIGRANKALPASQAVLTPGECRVFLTLACPPLLDGEWLAIAKTERKYWLLFWLALLGHPCREIPLHNRRSKSQSEPPTLSLHYEFDTREGCNVVLQLPADLVKGTRPAAGDKRYYTQRPSWSLSLPWPLQSVFNLVLRDLPSSQRHGLPLAEALSISPTQYRQWLKAHIKAVQPQVPFHLSPTGLHQTFLHFAREQVPDTALALLTGKACVQSHYVNQEAAAASHQVRRCWQAFLAELGATEALNSSSETHVSVTWGMPSYHDQVGSALTLRQELLAPIFSAILQPLQQRPSPHALIDSRQRQVWSERVALYLHLRAAMTLALRPVNQPYPTLDHIAFKAGLLTVQDKRSHHHDERRVLVADPVLTRLLGLYHSWQQRALPLERLQEPVGLSVFDGQQWQPLERSTVQRLLETYVGDMVPGGFRHLSASLWLEANQSRPEGHFAQTDLNLLMNHFLRGQSPIGQYSLLSLTQAAAHQQQQLAPMVAKFAAYDRQAETALAWLLGTSVTGDRRGEEGRCVTG
ncbi:hypothetical protein MD588_05425 [Photobacterium sp. SDRW27]|uniref:hypothetical protein n=1 Tax=Photobacterium obscurum TaxID=2829490 RepID=UPI002242C9C8|nr:hypothetical protein [Photobacterium obscurum]MCW8328244.1 hypothetical protein [Photobacterium obscurum]